MRFCIYCKLEGRYHVDREFVRYNLCVAICCDECKNNEKSPFNSVIYETTKLKKMKHKGSKDKKIYRTEHVALNHKKRKSVAVSTSRVSSFINRPIDKQIETEHADCHSLSCEMST